MGCVYRLPGIAISVRNMHSAFRAWLRVSPCSPQPRRLLLGSVFVTDRAGATDLLPAPATPRRRHSGRFAPKTIDNCVASPNALQGAPSEALSQCL